MLLLEASKLFHAEIERVLVRTIVNGATGPMYMDAAEEYRMNALESIVWSQLNHVEKFKGFLQKDSGWGRHYPDEDQWSKVYDLL
jgi:hypothetical protein